MKPFSTQKTSIDRDLFMTSLFLLLLFPILGNSISFGTDLPRRLCQAAVGILALLLCSRPFFVVFGSVGHSLWKDIWVRRGLLFLGIASVVSWLFNFADIEGKANSESYGALIFVFGWFSLFVLNLSVDFRQKSGRIKLSEFDSDRSRSIFIGVASVVGLWMAFKAWYIGPDANEIFMSLGGSTIVTGYLSALGCFSVLFVATRRVHWFAALPFLYLSVMSTARTIMVLVAYGLVAFVVREAYKNRALGASRYKTILTGVLAFSVFAALLVAPATVASRYYPYYEPESNSELTKARQLEYLKRMSRYVRLIRFSFVDFEAVAGASLKETEKVQSSKVSVGSLIYWSAQEEQRLSLVAVASNVIKEGPLGYWPKSFERVASLKCTNDTFCGYPHNIFMEVTFYFGWLVGLVFLMFGIYYLFDLARETVFSASTFCRFLAISSSFGMLTMQFSGSFFDYVGFLILAVCWTYIKMYPALKEH